METVKVFKPQQDKWGWSYVLDFLGREGIPTGYTPELVDVSIVLGGKHENPLVFCGKRILAYDANEWLQGLPPPTGWNFYHRVLVEYYDDCIDLTGMTVQERVDKLISEMKRRGWYDTEKS
jgi:hypothetical protein